MTGSAGLRKIVRFNWPWYAFAAAVTVGALALLAAGAVPPPWRALGVAALVVADLWLVGSLVVSHYVYDRSPIARGEWISPVRGLHVERMAVFHAGQDEASTVAARAFPSAELRAFDFYDPARSSTPSLERARSLAGERATAVSHRALPLATAELDLALVVFAAHEIRAEPERALFFRELARVVAPAGRVLVVEHLRDGWNFLAFGPGAFHFFSRASWLRAFAGGGLTLVDERRCTPFVRLLLVGAAA